MRDLFKFLIVGIALFFSGFVYAGDYSVLVIPDNIVTENVTVDSFIYSETAEFFANEIVTLLNETDNIKSPSISDIRILYKKDPATYLMVKNLTNRFKTSYNADSVIIKKLAAKTNSKYVLLITSYIDYENYVLRRTLWDFLNIPGATVVDPAYKISTYAVLYDTEKNAKIWADTYYKTISVCENRIITRGPSPQVEQLQKIRDYSRTICPQIAQSVQLNILPIEVLTTESKKISDDMGNLDNIFTKKYRKYLKSIGRKVDKMKDSKKAWDEKRALKKETKETEKFLLQTEPTEPQTKLEVKAQPIMEKEINTTQKNAKSVKTDNKVIKKETDKLFNTETSTNYPINLYKDSVFDVKKSKTNSLINNSKKTPPDIRSYSL